MENQYFDSLPLDSSRQVGDQILISGSPQTRFGRIGEWASGNLQPCLWVPPTLLTSHAPGDGAGQNVGLKDFCHILTLLPPAHV